MAKEKISPALLKTLTKPGVYGDGGGLYLQVRDSDRRTWIFRYMIRGKARWMGLGSLADTSLKEARAKAEAARKLAKDGVDPIEARDARAEADAADRAAQEAEQAAKARTFMVVAEAYIAAHEAGWRNAKHRQQWHNTLATYAAPVIGGTPIAEVTTEHVKAILEPIWTTRPETASRVRGRIEAILDYSKVLGWRSGENPARWRGHMDHMFPARGKVRRVQHHAALPWPEISAFMKRLMTQEGVSALALRFTILTAARTGESLGATWGEIDAAGALWTIPAERMKAGREHRVPLSDGALAVLTEAAKLRNDDSPAAPVFPGAKSGKPLSNMALLMLLRRMGRGDLTAHGFRSTFRDWVAEATNHPGAVAEAALAHAVSDRTEAAYQRGTMLEKRIALMTDWETYCFSERA